MSLKRTPSQIRLLQRAICHPDAADLSGLVDALDATVQNRLWAKQRNRGKPFESFSEFVFAPSPAGLGVQSIRPLRFLRHLLINAGYYAEWVELLERTMRHPGRPRKTLANGEGFHRFYRVPTALTSKDRMLLGLKQRPEAFTELCRTKGSIREAAIKAGVIPSTKSRRYGVCDFAAAKALRPKAQGDLLCNLFNESSLDAQCRFLARAVEPELGLELPGLWRGRSRP
jgi:hypothetical protein